MAIVVALYWAACGSSSVDGSVGPTGGEVCLPENKICIAVPSGSLGTQEVLRLSPGAKVPESALSEGFDISAVSGRAIVFSKPAAVSFSLDIVQVDDVPSENLLRVYTMRDDEWQPLENAFVDRVRRVVRGETRHLSPFVVLRADRLPDGGVPLEIDGGQTDGSIIVIPPFDAGRPDAGKPDAGKPDSGIPDAGKPDSGNPDAGTHDAGVPDAGVPDSGMRDAGVPDAGVLDAGAPDAGEPDAGDIDAGIDSGI